MSYSDSWVHQFEPFSVTHACVVLVFVVLVTAMVALRRHHDVALLPASCGAMDNAVGWIGLTAAVFVQVVTLWPSRFDVLTSLPLHVCDICMFVAPASLLLGWPALRGIGYFWGIGLSSMSFVIPDLRFGPGDFQFWVFWIAHTMIVGTAVYDITARGYRPRFRDWLISVRFGLVYTAVVFIVDLIWHLNYGYVGQTYGNQKSPADLMGPWPWRVPLMVLVAISAMYLLLLPWVIMRKLKGRGLSENGAVSVVIGQ